MPSLTSIGQISTWERVHLGTVLWEARRSRGSPHCQPVPVGGSPAPPWHLPPRPAACAPCKTAICFPTLLLSRSCCCLQFGFLLQTALPEGPLQRPMGVLRSGWLALEEAGGWLLEGPTICVWLWAAVTASQGDPDGHTSSVCWSPPTLCGCARQTVGAGSWPPTHMEVAEEVRSWGQLAPPSSCGERAESSPTLFPTPYLRFLPAPVSVHCREDFITTVIGHWPHCPAGALQRNPVQH